VDPALDPDPVTPARAIRRKKEEKKEEKCGRKELES
jgi:hypothetical protein